jgi:hypothetical protein
LDQLNELVVLNLTKLDNAVSEFDETGVPKLPAPQSPESAAAIESLSDCSPSLTRMDLIQTIHQLNCHLQMNQQPQKNLLSQQHVGCAGFTHGANRPQKVKVPQVRRWITLWMFTK